VEVDEEHGQAGQEEGDDGGGDGVAGVEVQDAAEGKKEEKSLTRKKRGSFIFYFLFPLFFKRRISFR